LPVQAVEPQTVAFVARGAVLIAGFTDGRLRRWDLSTREPITPPWRGSPASIRDLAVRLDDKFVTGNQDTTVILWDADRDDALSTALPEEHAGGVSGLIFTGVGRDLISGGYDKTVDLWDAEKRRVRTLVKTHPATIQSLAVSPDRRLFAFRDGKRLVSIGSFAEIQSAGQTLEGLQAFSNLAFADGGKTLLFGVDKGVLFWDVDRRSVKVVVPTEAPIISVAIADAANLVAAADRNGTITLVDDRTHQLKGKTIRHEGNIPSLALSPDGELLAAAGENGSIMVWRVSDGKLAWSKQLAHGQETMVLTFAGTGSTLASGGADGRIELWDAATGQSAGWLGNRDGGESVDTLDFSPEGNLLASGGQDGRIKLWDLDLADWKGGACHIAHRDFTPDEANLYFGERREGFCASRPNAPDHSFTDKH
jgi:WD40 repeat protein